MTPMQMLVIGKKRSAFAADQPIDEIVRMLSWYFPPNQMLTLMPEDWSDDQLTPLRSYLS